MIDCDRTLEEFREIIIKVVLKHSIGERVLTIIKDKVALLVIEERT